MLYIVRHGKATGKDENAVLTEEGIKETELIASKIKISPTIIYSSPLPRAKQTAEIFSKYTGAKVVILDVLRPEKDPSMLKSFSYDGVMLVGHNPMISNYLSSLLNYQIELGNSCIAGIEKTLKLLICPEYLKS
ncbi:phosphohistidine phosphatase SixA [Sulfurisphaera javensis]|uniref:Phosphohistidine phosphatase SixA n=1 Tax=Sulfurisphaera javensis TaxID=2049879 RepID=A0AAT9GSW6_9CREN